MKKILIIAVRILISLGLLVYLISLADIQKILATLGSVNLTYLLLAFALFVGIVFLLTRRWQILLDEAGIRPGYSHLFVFYLMGYFFNNFLPTTVGGDVSRAYNVARLSGKKAGSVGIVLLERVLGVLATLTFATFSLFWVSRYFQSSRIVIVTVGMFLILILALASLLNERLLSFFTRTLAFIKLFRLGERLSLVLQSIHSYRHAKQLVLHAYLLSLIGQFLLIFMNYLLALALGLKQVSLIYLFLVVPVTIVMGLLPSINGLGVRDSGYVILLTRIGLTPAEAISFSFLNTLVPFLVSLSGGLLLIFYRHRTPVKEFQEIQTEMKS